MSDQQTPAPADENQLIAERREKLKAMRQRQAEGKGVAFPNDFKPSDYASALGTAHAVHSSVNWRRSNTRSASRAG